MDGKSWLTGQNWIEQFIGNCARAGDMFNTKYDMRQ